jgi:hypothetical protein
MAKGQIVKSELERLFPDRELPTSAGMVILRPFPIQKFPGVIRLFKKYFDGNESLEISSLLSLLETDEAAADLNWLLSASTNQSPDFFADLGGEEYLNLIEQWWEINSSFFAQRVLPLVQRVMAGVTVPTPAPAAGPEPANS